MIYLIFAFTAGLLVVISVMLNANLAKHQGSLNATTVNYITGLTIALILVLIRPPHELSHLSGVPPYLFITGGFLGVCVISFNNYIVSQMAILWYTILLFSGQILSGFLLDTAAGITIPPRQIVGIVFIFSGIIMDTLFKMKKES